jgi:enoyl-CoA hydratase
MHEELKITEAGHIATLTLTRPRSLDSGGKHALIDKIEQLAGRDDLRALIIAAEHPAAFLVDVAELADMQGATAADFTHAGYRLASTLESLPFPVIAAVEGAALGGGCELVLACDLALAGEKATFGQIEAMGGVMPAFGGTWRLARRVGFQCACEMMFTGSVIDAATAKAYGLVLEVTAAGDALSSAQQLAERIAKTSRASVAAIKRTVHAAWNLEPSQIDALEEIAFPKLFGPEQSARMHAFLKAQETSNE